MPTTQLSGTSAISGRDVPVIGDIATDAALGSGGDAILGDVDASGNIKATSSDGTKSLEWNSSSGSLTILGNLSVTGNVSINDFSTENPLNQVTMLVDTVQIRDLELELAFRNDGVDFSNDEKQADKGIKINRREGAANQAFFGSKFIDDDVNSGDRFYFRVGTKNAGITGDSEFKDIYCNRISNQSATFAQIPGNNIEFGANSISHTSQTINIDATGSLSLDAGGASNFTTSAEALTLTSAAATTWSTASGILTLDGAGGLLIKGNNGLVDINTTGSLSLDAGAASNFTTSAGAVIIDGAGGIDLQHGSTSVLSITNNSTVTMKPDEAVTITHSSNSVDDDFTISQTGSTDSNLILSSTGEVVIKGTTVIDDHDTTVPTETGSTGTKGEIRWDATNLYVCISANTWKKITLEDIPP